MPNENLYDALGGLLASLKTLEVALTQERAGCTPRPKLAMVAGQGRGSKKPPAKLQSVTRA